MKPEEVRVEKVNLENINSDNKNNTNFTRNQLNSLLAEGMSFKDFMCEQLTFSTYISAVGSSDNKEKSIDKSASNSKDTDITNIIIPPQINIIQENNDIKNNAVFQLKALTENFESFYNIDAKQLSKNDIDQINQLFINPGYCVNINQTNGFNNLIIDYNKSDISKNSLNFSQKMAETLEKAYKTNRPIRIDFENQSSVILKIDKDGKLSAHFISSDKVMEMLLKDNLYALRAKFEKEGLPYKEFSFNDQPSKDNRERNSKNSK